MERLMRTISCDAPGCTASCELTCKECILGECLSTRGWFTIGIYSEEDEVRPDMPGQLHFCPDHGNITVAQISELAQCRK